jgi:hypothetical protein
MLRAERAATRHRFLVPRTIRTDARIKTEGAAAQINGRPKAQSADQLLEFLGPFSVLILGRGV